MLKEVTINDIGPIADFHFTMEQGKITRLLGRNGLGKTRGLDAIETLTSGQTKGTVEHRDGAARGVVQAFGATLRVAKSPRYGGELEVQSLEGRFSVVDLVDPKLKDRGAADAKRIKALVQLTGAEANPALFHKLVPGGEKEFNQLVSTNATSATDLVLMAARIKSDLEARARVVEDDAKKEVTRAESARAAAETVDLTATDDSNKLAEDLELASAEEARLKAERRAALDAKAQSQEAQRALADAETNYQGMTVAFAEVQAQAAARGRTDADQAVRAAEAALLRAQQAQSEAVLLHNVAIKEHQAAREHDEMIQKWRAAVVAGDVTQGVTDEQLAEATADVVAAREALEQGTLVREAKRRVAEAALHAKQAATLRTKADHLRDAARGTDDVLSEVVGRLNCPLKVQDARLVTLTDRGIELFSDLSRGEQWTIVINIAIEAVGDGGIIVIDQEGFEGLDVYNRALIANLVKDKAVYVLTAEATGDLELTADSYEPQAEAASAA
jgi:ABC-type cobalamin/Fe3+-siderophores transport system ATPase subunit